MIEHSNRDWTEDFSHENGMYQNTCCQCNEHFFGHKRRVICKQCVKINALTEALKTSDELKEVAKALCAPLLPKDHQKQYEEDLKRRQEEHLNHVFKRSQSPWQPCLHDSCPSCIGTGIKADGSPCVHYISCNCPKCSPSYLKINYFMASDNFENPDWFKDLNNEIKGGIL